jgi:hypothetical protein
MIKSKEISVVLQGPIAWDIDPVRRVGLTIAASRQIRRLLPHSEIILSTWNDQKFDAVERDVLILNDDPGAQGDWPGYTANNVNRQIVSTLAGLKCATRQYVLKIRTDMVLESTYFLKCFHRTRPLSPSPQTVFSRPVITNNLSSRCTSSILARLPNHPLLFHPSDHVSFGLIQDMMYLWDIPLQTDEDALYFVDRAYPNRFRLHELSRLSPEQYIFTSALGKTLSIDLEHYADMRDKVMSLSEFYMRTHIVSVPDRVFAVHFPKYHNDHHFSFEWMRRNQARESLPLDFMPQSKAMRRNHDSASLATQHRNIVKRCVRAVFRGTG